jgi:DNA-binding NarL/FixJ family response regulator
MANAAGAGRILHHTQYERALAAAGASLDEEAFVAAWNAGSTLHYEAAIAEARAAIEQATAATGSSATFATGPELTKREREVLRLLVDGFSDRNIAEQLFISRYTASNHVHAILSKLGVANRAAAVAVAISRDLV